MTDMTKCYIIVVGICLMTVQPMSSGLWTIYMMSQDAEVRNWLFS